MTEKTACGTVFVCLPQLGFCPGLVSGVEMALAAVQAQGEAAAIHQHSSAASLVLVLLLCSAANCPSPLASHHGSRAISPGHPARVVDVWKRMVETVWSR